MPREPRQRGFRRGSATYVCRGCGKRTRNVEGEESVELCLLCDTKAMAGNVLADHGYIEFAKKDPWAAFDFCTTREQVYELQTQLMEEMGYK